MKATAVVNTVEGAKQIEYPVVTDVKRHERYVTLRTGKPNEEGLVVLSYYTLIELRLDE